uniref:Coat protein 2 n=1 Tax=Subalpine fir deltapartitivirus TaxID=2933091 RepID=A0A9C7GWU1_9VIRU|nr:putative coat protein 2 [Subalpine fir deltapartitivirus]CAI5384013.1 putative coat protein 2 [Subalpine fir deltapartitivirus]
MSPRRLTAAMETQPEIIEVSKKAKAADGSSIITHAEVHATQDHPLKGKEITVHTKPAPPPPALDSTKADYGQVQQSLNEAYVRWLKEKRFLGWKRIPSEIKTRIKDVELELDNLRAAIENVMVDVLGWRMIDSGNFTSDEVATLSPEIAKSVSDAFMTAMYAKLRFIHQQSRTQVSRYSTRPSYSKVVELPLPLAFAIEGLGIVETHSETERRNLIPTIAEGTRHECRKEEEFNTFAYQTHMALMKDLEIPMKAIIPQTQNGNPWWTYKVLAITKKLNLQCTLPPSHYTEYSAHLRAVFLANSSKNEEVQLIKFDHLTPEYGTMFRERDIGFNRLAFEALCQASEEDWNLNSG